MLTYVRKPIRPPTAFILTTKCNVAISKKTFQFVFLPECCDYVGGNVPETLKLSQTIDGDTMQFYRNLSKSNGMWLSIGGFHEKVPKTVMSLAYRS